MRFTKQFVIFTWMSCWVLHPGMAQPGRVLIHAHNDYQHPEPFYGAYSQRVYSIEADVFATAEGTLLVGHDRSELVDDRTLERLYITPIVDIFRNHRGRAWKDASESFVLLIDLKTPAATTLDKVVQLVSTHPEVFDPSVNPNAVQVVISGDMPEPSEFEKYPLFISFDGRTTVNYTAVQLKRVAFISAPFSPYSSWKGADPMDPIDRQRIVDTVEKAHRMGKKIRFWATPDGEMSWKTLRALGVDIINTDEAEACAAYFEAVNEQDGSLIQKVSPENDSL